MKRCLRGLGWLFIIASGALLGLWTVGRVLSDRWVWSQLLSWLPSVLVIPVAWLAFGAAALLHLGGRSGRNRGRVARRFIMGWAALASLYWGLVECRLYRLGRSTRPASSHLRVLNWNINEVQKTPPIAAAVLPQKPDVAILVNPHSYGDWGHARDLFGPEYGYRSVGGIVVLSRIPVQRYGMAWLGLEGAEKSSTRKVWTDPGRAMFIEFDTTASLGRTTVFWVVDLPSNPRLSRRTLCAAAMAAIRAWAGPATVVEGAATHPDAPGAPGFPPPDVILGDFNTPRGAASLSLLTGDMRNAYDEAGSGYAATWPRAGYRTPIPLLQVDQMFVGTGLRVAGYRVLDPGAGFHRMQVADLVADH